MDASGSPRFHHRKNRSTDRFLGSYLQSPPIRTNTSEEENELNEDDIFSTGDFSPDPTATTATTTTTTATSKSPSSSASSTPRHHNSYSPNHKGFHKPESFGILAALPDHKTTPNSHNHFLQKTTIASSSSSSSSSTSSSSGFRPIPSIPKPPQERVPPFSKYHQHHSAPVNVPVLSMTMRKNRKFEDIDEDEEEGDGEMMPPHEIVALAHSPILACSVLEGVGRTLKGRDLRQVRNAVWRRTGFLD